MLRVWLQMHNWMAAWRGCYFSKRINKSDSPIIIQRICEPIGRTGLLANNLKKKLPFLSSRFIGIILLPPGWQTDAWVVKVNPLASHARKFGWRMSAMQKCTQTDCYSFFRRMVTQSAKYSSGAPQGWRVLKEVVIAWTSSAPSHRRRLSGSEASAVHSVMTWRAKSSGV